METVRAENGAAESTVSFYVRYVDDILVMDNSREYPLQVKERFENMLHARDLEVREEKPQLISSQTGLVYPMAFKSTAYMVRSSNISVHLNAIANEKKDIFVV